MVLDSRKHSSVLCLMSDFVLLIWRADILVHRRNWSLATSLILNTLQCMLYIKSYKLALQMLTIE